jgi:DMSO reductase iron-sulfur subunit
MTTLPLLESELLYRQPSRKRESLVQIGRSPLLPPRPLREGEQYRFHFDMTKCIGCKCCVVACNEQNGNPAAINWRRVGEIEGGYFPNTQRHYLSMGCNHCVEPSCMIGCPVEAYQKDPVTGVVIHDANTCIGCQYCTWNCSYGVPQYNAERGVVGKCDMCHNRLAEGREPACVHACPVGAIRIEIVNIAEWRNSYEGAANAPGLPSAGDSISTTRLTLPAKLPPDTAKVDSWRVQPEHPHWPLIFMLVLTQLSVGTFGITWLLETLGKTATPFAVGIAAFATGVLALCASTFHLGRPAFAWRALKMWRRSWLSREVLVFSLFAGAASLYAPLLGLRVAGTFGAGALTTLLGLAGITCSARIYQVEARPAWNMPHTIADFHLTAAILGPLFVAAAGLSGHSWLPLVAAAASAAQLLNQAVRFFALLRSDRPQMEASARLLSGRLRNLVLSRVALLVAGGIVLPMAVEGAGTAASAFFLALVSEFLGRYLFFVSVVPKNMAASYHVPEAA